MSDLTPLSDEERSALNATKLAWGKTQSFMPLGEFYWRAAGRYYLTLVLGICEDEHVDADATMEEADYAYNRACDDIAGAVTKRIPKE